MCIATALFISAFFLVVHATYQPFKTRTLNYLQTACLTMLTLLYFMG
jgi:hypothetical protein